MSTLAVAVAGDTFESVWTGLASDLDLELRVVSRTADIGPVGGLLPPILVIVGREDQAEGEIRSLLAAGHLAPIVVAAEADHRLAIRMLHAGAADYFVLPADLSILRSVVSDHARRAARAADHGRLVEAARGEYDFSRIVGRSPGMRAALERAARIIPHERASVLITGETGTGKELVAQAIHFNGRRAGGAFVEINCAAIPGNLLESELFGYERGAFTDAWTAKPGLFETAHGGTLFLDEIGHMPLTVQGKLLKAIEEKRVRRLGSVQVREIDTRIIAATHVHLAARVETGDFREDLYYRLTIIPIHLPPLRERGDDIILLAQYFLAQLAEQYDLPLPPFDEPLRRTLLAHTWPGNVRELRNTLERGILLGGGSINLDDLFFHPHPNHRTSNAAITFPAPLAEIERQAARAMVDRFDGNKSAAADALRISRSRLYRLLDGPDEVGTGLEPPRTPPPMS
jgi:DNA-binding NtrC family response regulator